MSFFPFLKDSSSEEISAVFNVGSGSVTGYLVKLSKKEKPEIVYSKSSPILFQRKLNLDRHFKLMMNSLDSVAGDLQKQGLLHLNFTGLRNHRIKKAYFMLSSPWCVSQTKTIKIKKEKPFDISHESIGGFLEEQETKFLSDDMIDDSIIVEKKIIDAKLNGYALTDIFGKRADEAEFAVFLTSASDAFLKQIKETVKKYFDFHSFNFHSFVLSSFSVIRDIYPEKESFLYIDIHGELTDLYVVRNCILVESVSFPIGRHFFIRSLSEKMRVSADEAVSMINLYFSGKSSQSASEKISAGIDLALKDWSDNLHSTLASLSLRMNLPWTVFMTVNDSFSALWSKKMREEKFSQFSMTEESFDVIVLDNKKLGERCKSDKNSKKEPVLELECLFLNKVFNLK